MSKENIAEAEVLEETQRELCETENEVLELRERVRNAETREQLKKEYKRLGEMVDHNFRLPKTAKLEHRYPDGLILDTKADIVDLTRMLK